MRSATIWLTSALVLAAAPAASAGKFLFVSADIDFSAGFGRDRCAIDFRLRSEATKEIQNIEIKVSAHDDRGDTLGSDSVFFSNIDPNKSGAAQGYIRVPCDRISRLVLRSVPTCRIAGKYYSDCQDVMDAAPLGGLAAKFKFTMAGQ